MLSDQLFVVQNEVEILSLIKGLMKKHQLISLSPDDTSASSISVVTDVNEDQKCFTLDALRNPVIHRRIGGGVSFSMETALDRVELKALHLKAIDTIGEAKDLRYQLALPARIHYFQQRQAFRASVPAFVGIETCITLPNPKIENSLNVFDDCDLLNISSSGCAISAVENAGSLIADFDDNLILKISLDEWDDALEIPAIKRHQIFVQRISKWQFGFEFIDLPPAIRHQIDRLVATIQLSARQIRISQ